MVWVALLNTGVSYAAERIVLACSGTLTSSLSPHEHSRDAEGIIIDLDAGLMMWGSDTFPLVSNEGNITRFATD